jgi:SPP1 family predicted phage head-tail adaptor
MRAGSLRHSIDLQRPGGVDDPRWGRQPSGWTTYATAVPASVRATKADERFGQFGTDTRVTHTVRLRFRDDIEPSHRILFDGRTLDIIGVIDLDGRRRELHVEAVMHGQAEGAVDA